MFSRQDREEIQEDKVMGSLEMMAHYQVGGANFAPRNLVV